MIRKTIMVDFHGVLCSDISGRRDASDCLDPPNEGAIEWLTEVAERFQVVIFSGLAGKFGGPDLIRRWLAQHHFPGHLYTSIKIQAEQLSWLTIDDRCIKFEGRFPTSEEIHDFRPWRPEQGSLGGEQAGAR